mmetsp:Transcript_152693/g.292434  ORF Transcript_152693/g.292434 Transcript_152693/m.292434 type:complete len:218 (+) Transcript_152693:136-789(+)
MDVSSSPERPTRVRRTQSGPCSAHCIFSTIFGTFLSNTCPISECKWVPTMLPLKEHCVSELLLSSASATSDISRSPSSLLARFKLVRAVFTFKAPASCSRPQGLTSSFRQSPMSLPPIFSVVSTLFFIKASKTDLAPSEPISLRIKLADVNAVLLARPFAICSTPRFPSELSARSIVVRTRFLLRASASAAAPVAAIELLPNLRVFNVVPFPSACAR